MHWRTLLGATLLILQGGAIVRARFVDDRYFCWAPFDRQTRYSIAASVDGRPLTPAEIRARYRRAPTGVDNRSQYHLFDLLARAEAQAPAKAAVTVRYTINGGPEQEWRLGQ